jgi:ribosomal protein S18 acetylase RimI-like enzyme
MATGPSFRPELDLLAVDESGRGVSALIAWLPGVDMCGMIEPMGTRPDCRREGHGRRVLLASFAAPRRLGATGVRVCTPHSNDAAVATYQTVGFRVITPETTLIQETPVGPTLTEQRQMR